MLNRRLAIPVLALSVLVAFATAAHANHSWNGYHWARSSNPFTLELGDAVNSTWEPYLLGASSDWSQSSVLNTTVVSADTGPEACHPTNGRVVVCNASYGLTGWLGVAQVWLTGGVHIYQGTVKLNDTYHNNAPYNQPAWRRLVTCQEIGHTFGLDHQDTNFNNTNLGTCMDYTNNPAGPPSNEHPNAHDYDELAIIYNHVEDTTTVGSIVAGGSAEAPPAMDDADYSGPGQWGELVALSRDGGQATFELDFGHGHKLVTFVTFTREVARDLAKWAARGGHFRK